MAKIRFRVRFNEGRVGVPLEKLERITTETRKFLESIASDLELPEDIRWLGSRFKNQSLSYDIEGNIDVQPQQASHFNSAVVMMSRGEVPPFITRESAGKFYAIAKPLETDERVRLGLYNGSQRPHWVELRPGIHAIDAAPIAATIEYVGAIQGTLHSWFREATPPYFYLRDASSRNLVKCEYRLDSVYDQLVEAVKHKDAIIHVHGDITTDRASRSIDLVRANKLVWVRPFSIRDLNDYLDSEKLQ